MFWLHAVTVGCSLFTVWLHSGCVLVIFGYVLVTFGHCSGTFWYVLVAFWLHFDFILVTMVTVWLHSGYVLGVGYGYVLVKLHGSRLVTFFVTLWLCFGRWRCLLVVCVALGCHAYPV